jgi:hypothetical protein
MCSFLFLLWCSAVVGRSGGPNIVGDNSRSSRFAEFNSRLGRANSRFGLPREFAGKGLICLPFFSEKRQLRGQNRRNSRLNGKSREFFLSAERPWHGVPEWGDLPTAVANRAQPLDVARAGDPRIVELADAGLAGITEPLGERSISGDAAYRNDGLFDVGLGPDLAARSGVVPLPYRHQLVIDEERRLRRREIGRAGVSGRDHRLAEQHRLGRTAAEAFAAVQ